MVVIATTPVMLNTLPVLGGVMLVAEAMLLPSVTSWRVKAYACRRPSSAVERSSVPAGPLLAAVTERDSIVVGMDMIILSAKVEGQGRSSTLVSVSLWHAQHRLWLLSLLYQEDQTRLSRLPVAPFL
jgi:hypothetical protein